MSNIQVPSSASSSTLTLAESSPRPQAGPLPTKRGEIGYDEEAHGQAMAQMDEQAASERPQVAMGERHPADVPPVGDIPAGPPAAAPANPAAAASTDNVSMSSSAARMAKLRKIRARHVGGVTIFSFVKLLLSIFLLAGTGVGWAFSIIMLRKSSQNIDPKQDDTGFSGSNSQIFVHVAFGVVALAQLVLLERLTFRVRAERYAFKHPGEMLRRGGPMSASMPMAPWQRPPLPTYAAALAQSGVRTGDVEDGLIAQPPPPAYGKTRGSTLLLQGFLNNEHRQRIRMYDEEAQIDANGNPIDSSSRRGSRGSLGANSVVMVQHPDRPVSYRADDPNWNEYMDAQRAQAVEQALTAMEGIGIPRAHISDRDRP